MYRSDPESLTRNIDARQLAEWKSRSQRTSAGIQVYGVHYPTPNVAKHTTDGIQKALSALTKCTTVEVSAPIAAQDENGDDLLPRPATYFAYNLTEEAAAKLKKQRCWSMNAISFFAYDLDPVIPEFLFTLHGFTGRDPEALSETVRNTLFSTEYHSFTASFALNDPQLCGRPLDSVMAALSQSLKVRPCGSSGVNVYCTSPTTQPDLWRLWRDVLGSANYTHIYFSTGRRAPDLICSGCHGAGHVRKHCPFGTLLGWNGARSL